MRVEVRQSRRTRGTLRFLVHDGPREATRKGIRQGFFAFGDDFMRSVRNDTIRGVKTGRIYNRKTRGGRRRRHQASSAGESHASFSGTLTRSTDYKLGGRTEIRVGYLDNPPEYAGFVEFRTRNMAPRPTIQNSIRDNMINGATAMEREIAKAWEEDSR